MPRRTIRLTSTTDERIESAAKLGGYSTASAFLRAAINKELGQGREGLGRAEEQIVASILEVRRNVRRIERAQQALFALVDSLAKVSADASVSAPPKPKMD